MSQRRILSIASLTVALCCLGNSCTIKRKWSERMKPVTYTGKVVEKSTGRGVAGATLQFKRPPYKFGRSFMGDLMFAYPEKMISVKSAAGGRFTATTKSGYATAVYVDKGSKNANVGSTTQSTAASKPLPEKLEIKIK